MSKKNWYPLTEWDEEQHQKFYAQLKNAGREERSAAILAQAAFLLKSHRKNKDFLKAAESLLGFWLLKVNHEPEVSRARDLLCQVYLKLGEPDKASAFSQEK